MTILLSCALSVLLLCGCKRRDAANNPLAGAWSIEKTSGGWITTWTNVVGADGRYREEIVVHSPSNVLLIETMTNSSNTNHPAFPWGFPLSDLAYDQLLGRVLFSEAAEVKWE